MYYYGVTIMLLSVFKRYQGAHPSNQTLKLGQITGPDNYFIKTVY